MLPGVILRKVDITYVRCTPHMYVFAYCPRHHKNMLDHKNLHKKHVCTTCGDTFRCHRDNTRVEYNSLLVSCLPLMILSILLMQTTFVISEFITGMDLPMMGFYAMCCVALTIGIAGGLFIWKHDKGRASSVVLHYDMSHRPEVHSFGC